MINSNISFLYTTTVLVIQVDIIEIDIMILIRKTLTTRRSE
jgi:hypothetical protein